MSDNTAVSTWNFRTLKNAYQEREPTRYVVDKFFATESLNIVFGAPGAMKSMLLADMCCHIAAGTDWLPGIGIPVTQSPVLWIDMDNGTRRTDERFDAIGKAHGMSEDAPVYYVSMPQPPLFANNLDAMLRVRDAAWDYMAETIVIDNLGLITGDVEENSAQMAVIMGNLRTLAERTKAAIILIHHQRKGGANGGRAGDSLRGHSSIEAAIDLAIHVMREENEPSVVLRSTKTRGVDVPQVTARFNFEHVSGTHDLALAWFDGQPQVRGENPVRDTILAYVDELGDVAITRLVELVHEHTRGEASKTSIRSYIDHMANVTMEIGVEKGKYNSLIIKPKRGKNEGVFSRGGRKLENT